MVNVQFTLIFALLLVLVPTLTILLQIFLSKRESAISGLILPGLCFVFSIIIVLSMVLYEGQSIVIFIIPFLLYNVPTAVLLAIYFSCREKFRKQKQLDKMNIHDL